jgi:hypothetical protein
MRGEGADEEEEEEEEEGEWRCKQGKRAACEMIPPPPPRRVFEGGMYACVSVCMDACVLFEAIATIIITIYYYY